MSDTLPLPAVDWAAPHEDPLTQLERQVVRGSHFTQAAMDELVARLSNAEAAIAELAGMLKAVGILAEEDVGTKDDGAGPTVIPEDSEESSTQATVRWPGIAFRVDPEGPERQVSEVNCAERMPVCHAVCCKLNFALTPPEVEAGTVKWDLGFPYLIRHEANGYCTHNDMATGRCRIYADRPEVCRRYSCANDPRIWTDFDNMVLNEAWIRENLTNQNRILVRTSLPIMEVNGTPVATS
jgi:Fe-S-cluster containining protein